MDPRTFPRSAPGNRGWRALALAAGAAIAAAFPAGADAASFRATVLDRDGHPVRDAVVTATALDRRPVRDEAEAEGIVDQVNKTFVPYVATFRAGTRVRFPNSDNIRHHVYSFSTSKRFELPLYAGHAAPPVLFDRPGVVVMGCNIHDWMVGYVYVADTPWFGRTDEKGAVELHDLLPGDYAVQIWHPEMDGAESTTARTIHVEEPQGATASWKIDLVPSLRPRRAPVPGSQGY